MPTFVGLVIILWIIVILLIVRAVVHVPTGWAYVVKRLGRVHRVLDPGLHLVIPIITSVGQKISMLEQVLDVPPFSGATAEGTPASVRGTVRFRVSDPARAASEVADFRKGVIELATRRWLEALRGSNTRDALNAVVGVESAIKEAAGAWGLEVFSATPLLMIEEEETSATPTASE
jgi:regulator of protease activity HflC (stomatin/prohibitin superfamily)